ncbi:hypothetical protein Emed_007214 [Eimeria media]
MAVPASSPVFLPGDFFPVLQKTEKTLSEVSAASLASAEIAAATAASFDWSSIRIKEERERKEKQQQQQQQQQELSAEIVGAAGICAKTNTACVFKPQNVLPPHAPVYVCCSNNCRYTPKVGDFVIGVVTTKGSEYYGVNIRSSSPARLAAVGGFEGATRRNKPQLSVGSVLLLRLSHLSPLLGAEVTCCSSNCSKPWTSSEKVLGELRDGIIVELPIPFALSMRLANCLSAAAAGKKDPAVLQAIVDALLQRQ